MDLEEYIVDSFYYQLEGVYTAIPCIVLEVNLQSQSVTVQPALEFLYKDNSSTKYPTISDVPLVFPASSTSAFTFPVASGDTVLVIFSQRGITTFKAGTGNITKPEDFRMFDRRDAIAIPGLFPFANSINRTSKRTLTHSTNDTVVAHNIGTDQEAEIRIKPSGKVEFTSPVEVEINSPTATVNSNVSVNGTLNATGLISSDTDVSSGTVTLKTHTHSGVTTGTDPSGPPVGA